MKKLLIILLLSLLPACVTNPRLDIYGMPHPPKDGTQDYRDGWQAGCETGMATYSGSYLRNRYNTNVDGERMTNKHYNRGWELGQRYCSYYANTYLANKEFTDSDLRSDETWFSVKADDSWFSYEGWDKFGW